MQAGSKCSKSTEKMPFTTFKSKARVIDLLGRQQIADIPTALGELFKNALDAGASKVVVNWKRKEQILSISDNGIGMRLHDVLNKWLVVATESKIAEDAEDKREWLQYATPQQKEWCSNRPHGEKGIGRLSVAKLGRYLAIWTVWGKGINKKGTLCIVHWQLFEHPTKQFEDLPIPYGEFAHTPTPNEIEYIFDSFITSPQIESLLKEKNFPQRETIIKDFEKIKNSFIKELDLSFDSSGTSFHIGGLAEEIPLLFQISNDEKDAHGVKQDEVNKLYSAFSVFWDPFHYHPERKFIIQPQIDGKESKELLARFWAPEDFKQCDHHIRIEVDETGYAEGTLINNKRNGLEEIQYKSQLKPLPTGTRSPGRILVEIGYLEGNAPEESGIDDETRYKINKRLEYAGGFYVYKDNVRIQPYGEAGSDFVGFEKRRLRNAGRYYFSMARMFGGVFLSSEYNHGLVEKAGREGFIVNGAYKGLRHYLCDLFIDLAYSVYGSNSKLRVDKQLAKKQKALRRQEENLQNYLEKVKLGRVALKTLEEKSLQSLKKIARLIAAEQNGLPGTLLKECEAAVRELDDVIAELYNLPSESPIGIVLPEDMQFGVDNYITKRKTIILQLEKEKRLFSKELIQIYTRAQLLKEKEETLNKEAVEAEQDIRHKIRNELQPAKEQAKKLDSILDEYEDELMREIATCREDLIGDLSAAKIVNDKSGESLNQWENAISSQYELYYESILPRIRQLVEDLTHLHLSSSSAFLVSEQTQEIQTLKESNQHLSELAQLGLIFATASHEYVNNAADVKKYISILKQLSHQNIQQEDAQKIISELEKSFGIIDERIRLYDPLIGKKGSELASITGKQIYNFILERINVPNQGELICPTSEFLSHIWPNITWPIFLGAIYNVVLNSMYWVKQGIHEKQCIRLSIEDDSLLISDNGPGVSPRDIDRIFSPGFSRRRGGRGLGLYIAQTSLKRIGYSLSYIEKPTLTGLSGACFKFSRIQ